MIIDHRTYTLPHGGMAAYLARYEREALPVQRRHLGPLIGFYVSDLGPLNEVVHLWAYDSYADREARRARLDADPDWAAFVRGNAGTFVKQEVKILRPASFSPRPG